MPEQPTAIVVGAGVVGMASCYALARRGWRVKLIEQALAPASAASYANGAQLSYCYTDALASPQLLRSLPGIVLGDSSIGLSPSFDPAFVRWMMAFMSNCTAQNFINNTFAGLRLAMESSQSMDRLLARHPIEFGHRKTGKMQLYRSPKSYVAAQKMQQLKTEQGCTQYALSAEQAIEREPALAGLVEGLVGAIFTPDERVGDSRRFCEGLLQVLTREYGVESHFATAVQAVQSQGGKAAVQLCEGEEHHADRVIVCAGAATPLLLKSFKKQLPIIPMKGYSFEMPVAENSPKVSITDVGRRVVFTNLGDRMRVAGLADLGSSDCYVDSKMSATLLKTAQASLPRGGDYDRVTNHWAGLRPMTPNSVPIIQRISKAIAVNAGHGMLGWTMAMGSGERLASLLED